MTFYELFQSLCKERGISTAQAARDNGLKQQSVSSWKTRGSTPKVETVQKLADYFGVSINFMLGNERERIIIPGRLKLVEVNDPISGFIRYNVEAADQEAFDFGLEILENAGVSVRTHTPQALVLAAMERLNEDGQQKVVERAEELTEIPRYRRYPAYQSPQPPPAPPEGKDTTPTAKPTEEPQEGG